MAKSVLVRYGAIPEVARVAPGSADLAERGERVVVRSHRGLEIGTLLEPVGADPAAPAEDADGTNAIVRAARPEDEARQRELRGDCDRAFQEWQARIAQWNLQLELIDLEWTLDRAKLILYVLNERGPDCTKLALQAAAAGLGVIEVQPVTSDGPRRLETGGGGCGNCGRGTSEHT